MRIHTIEENYDYRMKRLIKKFVKDYELENLSAEELQDKLWNEYSKEFAQAVLEDMQGFSGDELFENVTELRISKGSQLQTSFFSGNT